MDVYFFKTGKSTNSTWAPSTSGITPQNCQLKAPTDILNPVIRVLTALRQTSGMASVAQYNYAYIPDFNRYYWIKNWVLENNIDVAYMTVDVLASWKTPLLNNSCYVLRAQSDYNGYIKDTKYPVTAGTPTISGSVFQGTNYNPLNPAPNSYGVYVLGIINKNGSLSGCVEYYVMTYLTFMTFCQQLFNLSNVWGSEGADLATAVKQSITDPFQYIVSVIWLPYGVADFVARGYVTGTTTVSVGYNSFTTTGTAYYFNNSQLYVEFTNVVSLNIPKHPLELSRGAYMNLEPFSRYWCSFYPFCGQVELDSTLLQGKSQIHFLYTIDLRTGKGVLNITTEYTGSSSADWRAVSPLRVIEAQVGVDIPIAAIKTAIPASLGTIGYQAVVAAGSEFSGFGNLLKKGLATATNWVADLTGADEGTRQEALSMIGAEPITHEDVSHIATETLAMKSTAEITGSQGTLAFYQRQVLAIWGAFYNVTADSLSINGRPLCAVRQLSTLSGFVLCDKPDTIVVAGATVTELHEMVNLLAQGIYIQ